MFNKFYDVIKSFIKENYRFLIILFILVSLAFYDTGYSIYKPGGIINVSQRVHGKNAYESVGSFNMAYVGMVQGRLPYYLLAKIMPEWKLVKNEKITYNDKETIMDTLKRDKLYYEQAISNAKMLAYQKSGVSYTIKKTANYIVYVSEKNNSSLKIGDEIISYDNNIYNNLADIIAYVNSKTLGDYINIKYKRDSQEYTTKAKIYEEEGQEFIGISVVSIHEIDSKYQLTIDTKSGESGPSGGLILSLVFYNALTSKDITNGKKVVGTGTLDADGNVGEIGSITYKIASAVKKKADIFLCPKENYEEAVDYAKKHNYDIIIKEVSTFDEALNILESLN